MSERNYTPDEIEDYLEGKMGDAEKAVFEATITEDKALAEMLDTFELKKGISFAAKPGAAGTISILGAGKNVSEEISGKKVVQSSTFEGFNTYHGHFDMRGDGAEPLVFKT